jgi:hypothetical protein
MDSNLAQLEAAPSPSSSRSNTHRGLTALVFTLAVFLSAALLFVVEPMFGKMVLPLLGGSPAVWTTCMLFFQGALLVGYFYAHSLPRWLGLRRHTLLHLALLGLCLLLLPVSVERTAWGLRLEHPNLWLLLILTISLGAPFVLLSSTGPLLQVWFSRTSHPSAQNPYFLYAASNAGSLIALLSYPFLIEPAITLYGQRRLWSVGYIILALLVALAATYPRNGARSLAPPWESSAASRIATSTMVRWTLLAFVPSSFFLALTTYITTDIAAVPLLWIIPLVLYLLSFTIVFRRRGWTYQGVLVRWQPIGLIALAVIDFWGPSASGPWLLPLHLLVFFVTALVCHGELAATKPPPSRLTDFYLCIAVGGVLGGVFNALVAPALFDSVLEYPLTILLACALRPWPAVQPSSNRSNWWEPALLVAACAVLVWTRLSDPDRPATAAVVLSSAVVAMVCLRMSRDPARFTLAIGLVVISAILTTGARRGVLLKERNFFGVREVREDTQKQLRWLMHGTTNHGAQSTDPAKRREPVTYYHRPGPIGDVFRAFPPAPGRRVAVIGLGAGGLAAYAGPEEEWTFYEIDPDIARVASDTNYFTYLKDTPAKTRVILGDGRLSLADAPDHHYDVIVVDAFSSDAIPTHLLTLEALSVYRSKLAKSGVIAWHLSNRYLELEPVLARFIRETGVAGLIRSDTDRPPGLDSNGYPTVWAALASRPEELSPLQSTAGWRSLRIRDGVGVWTDDFSNIFSVFIWSVPRMESTKAGGKSP